MSDDNGPGSASILVPEFSLRSRVAGAAQNEEDYRRIGIAGVDAMNRALAILEKDVSDFGTVLDFACGPARVLQHLHLRNPRQQLYGADVDPEAIAWCREHLDYGSFECNDALPPLPYSSAKFDFIYALSVFSHLEQDMQRSWLSEMTRLLRPEGAFYLTFSGHYVFDKYKDEFPGEAVSEFEAEGFCFIRNMGAEFYKYPEWYQTSLQEIIFMRMSCRRNYVWSIMPLAAMSACRTRCSASNAKRHRAVEPVDAGLVRRLAPIRPPRCAGRRWRA